MKASSMGVENFTMDLLGKICTALNCTLDDICEFEDYDYNLINKMTSVSI